MDPLFSHAPHSEAETEPARVRDEVFTVSVPAPREVAYAAFTGDLHLWWPVEQTVFGPGTHPAFEGEVLGEESEDGRLALWARLVDEEAPDRLVLDWHLGGDPARASRVVVVLEGRGEGTSLTVRMQGGTPDRETTGAPVVDWATALGRFAAFFGMPADSVERD